MLTPVEPVYDAHRLAHAGRMHEGRLRQDVPLARLHVQVAIEAAWVRAKPGQ
jgi:hypothetical protein